MSTKLLIGTDINGVVCDAIGVAQNIIRGASGAGVAVNITVPQNVDTAYFSFGGGGDYWVDLTNTATAPAVPMESSTSELNPVSRFVVPGSTVSLYCSVINVYQVSFYATRRG
jgi:hypothetical protein